MNVFKKAYCRVVQTVFRCALPLLPYREPKIYNSVSQLSLLFDNLGAKSILLITGPHLYASQATKELENLLAQKNIACTVFSQTKANPTVQNVESALALYNANNCQCIIAFGGGSPIDCAKAVGARVAYPNKNLSELKGVLKVKRKIPPLIAIPTTAGTGSEATLAAVITDENTCDKYAISSFPLIPNYAVLDAKLTATLPPHLTATTGMDALTHAVEAYIGRSTTKQTRKMALAAVRLIFENIEKAYEDGNNLCARENMLNASYLAGVAFSQSYVGYIHAIAHSLGGKYNIPHGLANAVIMPPVLEGYGKSAHKKLHELAIAAGVATSRDSHEVAANKFICAIKELNFKMGIPQTLEGICTQDIPALAKHADKEANPLYPVPKLMCAKQLQKFYYQIKK